MKEIQYYASLLGTLSETVPVLIVEEVCFVLGLKHPPRSKESSRESMPGDSLESLHTCTG